VGQIAQPPTVSWPSQAVTKRNVYLLFSGEPDNDHCDTLLPIEEKNGWAFFTKYVL
jgi:hypothetical protein